MEVKIYLKSMSSCTRNTGILLDLLGGFAGGLMTKLEKVLANKLCPPLGAPSVELRMETPTVSTFHQPRTLLTTILFLYTALELELVLVATFTSMGGACKHLWALWHCIKFYIAINLETYSHYPTTLQEAQQLLH